MLEVCESVLPAADFDCFEVLPSRKVLEAALAAFFPVCLFGVPVWDRALPDEVLDFDPVPLLVRFFDALEDALLPVVLLFVAISDSPIEINGNSLKAHMDQRAAKQNLDCEQVDQLDVPA